MQVCLNIVGTPASDTFINVTLIPGSAGEEGNYRFSMHAISVIYILSSPDFNLITPQVTTSNPCISFAALADNLGLEGEETLTLSLSGPSNVQFENSTLEIHIIDADSMQQML